MNRLKNPGAATKAVTSHKEAIYLHLLGIRPFGCSDQMEKNCLKTNETEKFTFSLVSGLFWVRGAALQDTLRQQGYLLGLFSGLFLTYLAFLCQFQKGTS